MGDYYNNNNKVAYIGYLAVVPNDKPVSVKQSTGTTTLERTYRDNTYDKQSGSYARVSEKQSISSGDYSNRGKVGYKNEFKTSSTVKVGDKSGYTEYYTQERVTRVDYNSGSSSGSGGSKGYIGYGGGNTKSSGGGNTSGLGVRKGNNGYGGGITKSSGGGKTSGSGGGKGYIGYGGGNTKSSGGGNKGYKNY